MTVSVTCVFMPSGSTTIFLSNKTVAGQLQVFRDLLSRL